MEAFYALATEDYRQLATAVDWAAELTRVAAGRDAVRLLDVACGSGKFPAALLARPAVRALAGALTVHTDLLDPSAFSLAEARGQLQPPFVGAADHECTLQELAVPEGGYDVVWSLHGLYAVPAEEVPAAMRRFAEAVAPGGLGVIAQATGQSHYLVFDEVFRRSFDPSGSRVPYSTVEQLVAGLAGCGVTAEGPTLRYETSVAREDRATAEGFLQRCAFDDTVSLDQMLADPQVGAYLRSCERGDRWVFSHEVRLVTTRPVATAPQPTAAAQAEVQA